MCRTKIVQWNWRRNWKKKVEPYLDLEVVQLALDLGMRLFDKDWKRGEAPYMYGAIGFNQRVVTRKLSWYQPLSRCHWIVFFSCVIGKLTYPRLHWKIVSGEVHTVAVGNDDQGEPRVVMDILCFTRMTAEESLARTHMKRRDTMNNNDQANAVYGTIYEGFVKALEEGGLLGLEEVLACYEKDRAPSRQTTT